jgi:hypothetical protein
MALKLVLLPILVRPRAAEVPAPIRDTAGVRVSSSNALNSDPQIPIERKVTSCRPSAWSEKKNPWVLSTHQPHCGESACLPDAAELSASASKKVAAKAAQLKTPPRRIGLDSRRDRGG